MPKTIHTAYSHGAIERIRQHCARRGIKAWELAKRTGLALGVCQRLLAGQIRQPSFEAITMCANALDLSLEYLAGFTLIPSRFYGDKPWTKEQEQEPPP